MIFSRLILLFMTVTNVWVLVSSFAMSVPTPRRKPLKMSLNIDKSKLPGQLPPFGYFDPLRLSESISSEELKKWREAEIKHGRLSMLAAIGIPAAEQFHPLFKQVQGPSIYHFQEVRNLFPQFWIIGMGLIGFIEFINIGRGWQSLDEKPSTQLVSDLKEDYIPGDLGWDPLNLKPTGSSDYNALSKSFVNIRNKELQNGRLAMLAVAGMIAQELVDGNTIIEHYQLYGLRAAIKAW